MQSSSAVACCPKGATSCVTRCRAPRGRATRLVAGRDYRACDPLARAVGEPSGQRRMNVVDSAILAASPMSPLARRRRSARSSRRSLKCCGRRSKRRRRVGSSSCSARTAAPSRQRLMRESMSRGMGANARRAARRRNCSFRMRLPAQIGPTHDPPPESDTRSLVRPVGGPTGHRPCMQSGSRTLRLSRRPRHRSPPERYRFRSSLSTSSETRSPCLA